MNKFGISIIFHWRFSRNVVLFPSVVRWAIAAPRHCTQIQRCSRVRQWFPWNDPNWYGNSVRRRLNRAEKISRRTLISIQHWWCAANPNRSSDSWCAAMICSSRKRLRVLRWPIRQRDGSRAMPAISDCLNRIWSPERVELKLHIPLVSYSLASMHRSLDLLEYLWKEITFASRRWFVGRIELTCIGM